MKLYLKSRGNNFNAVAQFEDGMIVVLPGSTVSLQFASHIRGGKTAKRYRSNPDFVNELGEVLQPCTFKSPSTAAQFVTGTSRNGYLVWKNQNKIPLKKILEEQEE